MENEKGFSLIEVIASILLLTIVLTSFFTFFIQTNKAAVTNNEKLVVINLADAVLERLKLDPTLDEPEYAEKLVNTLNTGNPFIFDLEEMNGKDYNASIKVTQDVDEASIKLFNVIVTVTAQNGHTKSSVEGYVSYD
ncbi:prepilin-type N-terminal cleavage/methylation domain-containing protein [Sporosarcina sp. 6E9]|uniref:type IV pilus modification PilV family protein n=1 Tax=Sporosarcina sp. 6E9 TaxID=2819235 RepID=UPI001AC80CB7|nr:type II secretion system protein [Sporosarcina sp. 6E9]MBO1911748.1 type II secretion system protein [Microvirga sp. 3-52]